MVKTGQNHVKFSASLCKSIVSTIFVHINKKLMQNYALASISKDLLPIHKIEVRSQYRNAENTKAC